jgi:hypothetical protein
MANIGDADAAAFGVRYSICPADLTLLVMLFSTPFTPQYVALSLPCDVLYNW